MTLVELRRLIRVFADSMYQYRVSQSIGHLVCSMIIYDLLDPLPIDVDWFQSLKQFFIKVSYHILVASLTLMALF